MANLEWLKQDLFEDILKKTEENYEKIINFTAKPAFEGGENYLSILWAVDVEVQMKDDSTKCRKFMLKVPPQAQQALAIVSALGLFDRESAAYYEMIPVSEELYQQQGLTVKFGPNVYKFSENVGVDMVLMDDIRDCGYKNMNRFEGLDMEHAKCALEKLAQFHAASAAFVADKRKLPDIYMKPMMSERMLAAMQVSQKPQEQKLIDSLALYNAEYLKEDIENYRNLYVNELLALENLPADGFYVLSHGDCWSNNIMFKHDDEGKIIDTLFVDFQVGRYTIPSMDLQYFLLCSLQLDIKLEYFDYFVQYYHENLVKSLTLLKYEKAIPTLRDLHRELFQYSFVAFTIIVKTLPISLLDATASSDLNLDNVASDGKDGGSMLNAMYTNSNYVKHLQKILPWMKNRGYFG